MKLTSETESRIAQLLESGFSTKFVMHDCMVCRQTVVHVRKKRMIEDVDYDRRNQTIRFLQLSGNDNDYIADHMKISKRTVKMVIATYEHEAVEKVKYGAPVEVDTAWLNFANGIIIQAVKEWKTASNTLRKNPKNDAAIIRKAEVERFFHSTWFAELSSMDPDYLLNKISESEKKKHMKKHSNKSNGMEGLIHEQ